MRTRTTKRYTLSLHDALPICPPRGDSHRIEKDERGPRRLAEDARRPGQSLAGDRGLWPEDDRVALRVDRDRVAVVQLALQQLERKRVLNQALDGPLERPRPEGRVVALASQEAPRRVGDLELDPPRREPAPEVSELDVHDPGDLVAPERREDHYLVDPVEKLRPERVAQLLHQERANLLGLLVLAEDVAPEIRRHDRSEERRVG